jgi:hypothetical protein
VCVLELSKETAPPDNGAKRRYTPQSAATATTENKHAAKLHTRRRETLQETHMQLIFLGILLLESAPVGVIVGELDLTL